MPAGCGFAGHVTGAAMDEGLLLLTAGWRETIRFIPPINVSQADVATALDMLTRAFDRAVATWKGPPPLPRGGQLAESGRGRLGGAAGPKEWGVDSRARAFRVSPNAGDAAAGAWPRLTALIERATVCRTSRRTPAPPLSCANSR